jgi:hypothetical protein
MSYKRFMVFTYNRYYPGGGLSDHADSFDTLQEAKEYIQTLYTTMAWSETRIKTEKKVKYFLVLDHITVKGPDHFEVLDLDDREQVDIGWVPPENLTTEVSRELVGKKIKL